MALKTVDRLAEGVDVLLVKVPDCPGIASIASVVEITIPEYS